MAWKNWTKLIGVNLLFRYITRLEGHIEGLFLFLHEDVENCNFLCSSLFQNYLLAQAEEIAIDLTFNEISDSDHTYYLMNIAIYCEELDRWLPGSRFRLTSKREEDYQKALKEKRNCPEFNCVAVSACSYL